jgi:addiction module RelE/StbE family toxin
VASKHVVRYLPVAIDDLTAIYDWIANDHPSRASSFIEKIDKHIGNLAIHPYLGRVPRDPKLRGFGYRVLIIEPYLVFYVIRRKTVEIHRVIHGSRQIRDVI